MCESCQAAQDEAVRLGRPLTHQELYPFFLECTCGEKKDK
jgi:hypothetical protein